MLAGQALASAWLVVVAMDLRETTMIIQNDDRDIHGDVTSSDVDHLAEEATGVTAAVMEVMMMMKTVTPEEIAEAGVDSEVVRVVVGMTKRNAEADSGH